MGILTFASTRRTSGSGVAAGLHHLWSEASCAWRTRQASRAMSELSDIALHDIGVTRAEIDSVVRHGRASRL